MLSLQTCAQAHINVLFSVTVPKRWGTGTGWTLFLGWDQLWNLGKTLDEKDFFVEEVGMIVDRGRYMYRSLGLSCNKSPFKLLSVHQSLHWTLILCKCFCVWTLPRSCRGSS